VARLVEVAGLLTPVVVTPPAVVVVPLTVLTVVLEVSKPAVVVVLLWPPGITVDSLTSVSGRCRNAEGSARTYLIVSLDVVVSVVVAGGWPSFSVWLWLRIERTYGPSGGTASYRCASLGGLIYALN
jgi:hypothetical protein